MKLLAHQTTDKGVVAEAEKPRLNRAAQFYESTVGKKVVMAVTGAILFGFVIGHLIGNLQIFLGREQIDAYGEFLHSKPAMLWAVRLVLLAAVMLHVVASVQLALQNRRSRPIGYVKKGNVGSTYASRTMLWSGPIILAFVMYHLLHFTFGAVHPNFQYLKVYDNMVTGFRQVPVSIGYIVAMLLLGMHLYHGIWSMFQSIGITHPRYTPRIKAFAGAAAALIVIGNISIPIAILAGWVGD